MARVKRVRIRNIMGIEEVEFEPGSVTRIEGSNASGKTSVLESLKAVVAGGHDATLLRKGAEEGEVVLVLDDDVEIRKRVTAEKSDLSVRHPEFGKISAPKSYVEKIIDATAFNPVRFLTADNRVELLLDAVGAKVDPSDLRAAVDGVPEEEIPAPGLSDLVRLAETENALEAIERVRSRVYYARTGVNRVARDKRTTAAELRASLPAEGVEPSEVEKALKEAEASLEAEREERQAKLNAIAEKALEAERTRKEEERKEIDAIRAKWEEKRKGDEAWEAEEKEKVRSGYAEEIDRWTAEVGSLRERLRTVEEAWRSRELIRKAEEEAEAREEEAKAFSAAIDRLDALKVDALSSLPIEGAAFEDGDLYVDGVAFDRLNSAKKVELVMKIAEVRAGDLGLVVVDDLELLDAENFAALSKAIEASPLQAIVTRVRDGSPLSISTEEAP